MKIRTPVQILKDWVKRDKELQMTEQGLLLDDRPVLDTKGLTIKDGYYVKEVRELTGEKE